MKITVDYSKDEQDLQLIKVVSANYLSDFVIRLSFNDGTEKVVDFKPFLTKSLHPSIKKYLDEKVFSKFQIIEGNLNWNDYDLIFPLSDLYEGKIN